MSNTDPDRPGGVHGASTVTPVAKKKAVAWLPWLLALLGLLLLFLLVRSCADDDRDTTATTEQTTTTTTTDTTGVADPNAAGAAGAAGVAGATGPAVTPGLAIETVTLPNGTTVEVSPGTMNYEFQRYLTTSEPVGRRFNLDAVDDFATESAALPASASRTVAALSRIMAAYPNATVRIEGYADARGTPNYNEALGGKRAESLARALIDAGVPAARITTGSGGETNPVATNATPEGRSENRRTAIVVTAK